MSVRYDLAKLPLRTIFSIFTKQPISGAKLLIRKLAGKQALSAPLAEEINPTEAISYDNLPPHVQQALGGLTLECLELGFPLHACQRAQHAQLSQATVVLGPDVAEQTLAILRWSGTESSIPERLRFTVQFLSIAQEGTILETTAGATIPIPFPPTVDRAVHRFTDAECLLRIHQARCANYKLSHVDDSLVKQRNERIFRFHSEQGYLLPIAMAETQEERRAA